MRVYQPIWHRIRANPGVRVPIECPSSYMQRVILAVKKERAMDKVYNRVSAARNKTGIVYKSTANHPEKQGIAVVSFILIEYAAVDISDLKYLVKFPPAPDLMERIGVKELEAEYYSAVRSTEYADMNYEMDSLTQTQITITKGVDNVSITGDSWERNGQSNFIPGSLDGLSIR